MMTAVADSASTVVHHPNASEELRALAVEDRPGCDHYIHRRQGWAIAAGRSQ